MQANAWFAVALVVGGTSCGGGASRDGELAPDSAVAPDGATAAVGAPGTVASVVDGCARGVGGLPGTACQTLTIACPDIEDLDVEVRITPPAAGVAERGTINIGSGGGGQGFSYDEGTLLPALAAAGFRLVQRGWADGWTSNVNGNGLVAASCRYATLAHWVRDTLVGPHPLCATGNSGGAAELGQALTRWNLDAIFDYAVPTSGPGMARVDYACLPDAAWLSTCAELNASSMVAPACDYAANDLDTLIDAAYAPATPCADADEAARQRLFDDSSLGAGADLEITHMRLDVLLGTRDGLVSYPEGQVFVAGVHAGAGGVVTMAITPEARHSYPDGDPGEAVLRDHLVTQCVARH